MDAYMNWCISIWVYVAIVCVLTFFVISCAYRRAHTECNEEALMLFIFGSLLTAISFPLWPAFISCSLLYFIWDFASAPSGESHLVKAWPFKKATKTRIQPIENADPYLQAAEKEVEIILKESQ